jgi:hypothetical protein
MSSNTNPLNEGIRAGPQHHLHSDNEPLPGSKGGATTIDYTPETIDETRLPPSEEGNTQDLTYHTHHHRHRGTKALYLAVTCTDRTTLLRQFKSAAAKRRWHEARYD